MIVNGTGADFGRHLTDRRCFWTRFFGHNLAYDLAGAGRSGAGERVPAALDTIRSPAMRVAGADKGGNIFAMEIGNQQSAAALVQAPLRTAKFAIGQVVKHRIYPFRGVIFDVDPVFANTEEWLASIPEEVRPRRDQPFYHLLAENAQTTYVAYVSEQNLLADETGKPVSHPQVPHFFKELKRGHYISRDRALH
jgi:heat shock protein HspQ